MKLLRAFWPAPLAAGLLMVAAFPPYDLGFLMPLAWALLFASMRARRGARAGWQVFAATAVLFGIGFRWIWPLVGPLTLVVIAWSAAWEGLWGRLAGRFLARGARPHAAWIVVLPASHLLADMLRTTVLTGFPWMLPGYSAWRNPVLLGSMDLIGVHGATLAILVLGAGIAEGAARLAEGAGAKPAMRALAPAAILWGAFGAWAFGKPAIEERPGPTLLLLQPAIPQLLKEDALARGEPRISASAVWERQERLAEEGLAAAARAGRRVDAVVWAETMLPVLAARPLERGRRLPTVVEDANGRAVVSHEEADRATAASRGAQTLAGLQSIAPGGRRGLLYNSVVLLDAEGRILGHQDKQHLTPGGEYIPLRALVPFREDFERWLEEMVGFLPDLQAGESANLLPLAGGARAGVLICYESLFPEIPREMVALGADLIVNQSNYGWFAGTDEMEQAFAVCAVRAAELRRSVVAASNNGICGVLGPDGRPRGEVTRADETAWLLVDAPLAQGRTPFVLLGEWAAWTIGAAAATAAVLTIRRAPATPTAEAR